MVRYNIYRARCDACAWVSHIHGPGNDSLYRSRARTELFGHMDKAHPGWDAPDQGEER